MAVTDDLRLRRGHEIFTESPTRAIVTVLGPTMVLLGYALDVNGEPVYGGLLAAWGFFFTLLIYGVYFFLWAMMKVENR